MEVSDLEIQIESFEDEIKSLKTQNDKVRKTGQQRIDALKQELEALQAQNKELEEKVHALEQPNRASVGKKGKGLECITEEDQDEADDDSDVQSTKTEYKGKVEELEKQLADKVQQVDCAQKEHGKVLQEYHQLKEVHGMLQVETNKLEKVQQELSAKITHMDTVTTDLNRQIDDSKEQNEASISSLQKKSEDNLKQALS